MRTVIPTILAITLLTAFITSTTHAQAVPGAPTTDWDRSQSDYSADMLRTYNELARDWREAWVEKDARAAAALYSDYAYLLVVDGAMVQGNDSIRSYLSRTLPGVVEMRTGLSDFMASDRLAYALGPFFYQYREGGDGLLQNATGTFVTVLVREGRDWKIRSQVFRLDPPQTAVPGGS